MKRMLIVALGLLTTVGCVKKINTAGQRAQQAGLLSTWMTWIKDKGQKFDAEWNLMNESDRTLIVMSDDVSCSRGSAPGSIRTGPFDRANVSVSLRPGQRKSFIVVCDHGSDGGDFRIRIGKLYDENPANGLKGQVVAENLVLVLSPGGQLKSSDGSAGPAPLAKSSGGGGTALGGSVGDLFTMKSGSAVGGNSGSSSSAPPPTASAPPPPAPPPSAPPPAAAPPRAAAASGSRGVASGGTRQWPAAVQHPDWVLAIMDVEDVNAHARGKAIDRDLVRNIGDQIRIFVAERGIQTVDKSAQEAAIKENIARMKSESYAACYDDSCQVELGKALAATHILRSKITRFGSKCVLNGELIDLRAEVAVAAASSRGDCVAEGFLNMSEEVAVSITAQ